MLLPMKWQTALQTGRGYEYQINLILSVSLCVNGDVVRFGSLPVGSNLNLATDRH